MDFAVAAVVRAVDAAGAFIYQPIGLELKYLCCILFEWMSSYFLIIAFRHKS